MEEDIFYMKGINKEIHLLIQSKCRRVPLDDSEKEMKEPTGILEYEYRKIRDELLEKQSKNVVQSNILART